MTNSDNQQLSLGNVITTLPAVRAAQKSNAVSPVRRRLLEPLEDEQDIDSRLCFLHSVFCQTSLPYRDPGDDVRTWERLNGNIHLKVLAGEAMHPVQGRFVPLGLPFGPKPRLILAHLNAEALRSNSPEIEIEGSLTAFVRRLKLANKGRNMLLVKDQLARLSASSVRFGMIREGQAITVNSQIVTAFDLWFPKDDRQRVLWPSTVRLSLDYFESLKAHAVPLDEQALSALSHSALALDLYAWLAQRLHRVKPGTPAFITWAALKAQFGPDYERMRKFKEIFRIALRQVLARYRVARIELDDRGMTLRNSPPPVGKRIHLIPHRTSE